MAFFDWLRQKAGNVVHNVADLPAGLITAAAAPILARKQAQAETQTNQHYNDLQRQLSQTTDLNEKRRIIGLMKGAANAPNFLTDFNSQVTDPGYAKRIGGTFFDVATLPLGAAEGFTARSSLEALPPAQKFLAYSSLRGAEATGFGAARDLSQGEPYQNVLRDAPRNFAFGAGANAVLSPHLTTNAVKEVPQLINETKAATAAASRPGMAPGFAKLPLGNDLSAAEKLQALKDQLSVVDDALANHPGKELIKYTNKDGVLPEVLGQGKSQFGRKGDVISADILNEFGGSSGSLEAQKYLDEYRSIKAHRDKIASAVTQLKTDVATGSFNQGPIVPRRNRFYSQPESVGEVLAREKMTGKALGTTQAEHVAAAERGKLAFKPQLPTNPSDFKTSFADWIGHRESAKTKATIIADRLNNTPPELHQAIINGLEGGPVPPPLKPLVDEYRKEYDALFMQATKMGVDMNYLQNYITHIWQKSPEDVAAAYKAAKPRFGFSGNRTIPTYQEGLTMGLKPKYTNPSQIIGEYARKLEETKANIQFLGHLKANGDLVPASIGANEPGYMPITAPGLPQNLYGGYWAKADIAQKLNKVFSPEESSTFGTAARIGAKVSGAAQDVLLSGGIPKTPLNAFTIAQMTKEVMAGRLKSPLISMIRSTSEEGSKKFFADNAGSIIALQERGVPIKSNFDYQMFGQATGLKQVLGETWNKAVNEPTFRRFMPMLQVNMFNDVQRALIKAGKLPTEAGDIAAQAVKNFYGITDAAKLAVRSKTAQNVTSTLLFAPRYRESMVNFWINNLKALKNPLAPENRANVTFGLSAVLTYLAMNEANKTFTGHSMNDNPSGKEDKLLIPLGNGKTLGIPFLSSIATVPRAVYKMGKDIVGGDFKGAAKEAGAGLSVSLRPLADVLNNENYFGTQIYSDADLAGDKYKKVANYLLNPVTGAYTHPYLREGIKLAEHQQGVGETLSKATELPLRFYDTQKMNEAAIWDQYAVQKKVQDIQTAAKYGKVDPQQAQAQIQKLMGGKGKPGQLNDGDVHQMSQMPDGSTPYIYRAGKQIGFADTLAEANLAVAKAKFKESGKAFGEYGDNVFRLGKDGNITSMPKLQYSYSLNTNKMQMAKSRGDLKTWTQLAEKQLGIIQNQLQDPSVDELERSDLIEKANKILDDTDKYQGYGGFKKPKAGRSLKANSGISRSSLNAPRQVSLTQPSAAIRQPSVNFSSKITLNGTTGAAKTRSRPTPLRIKRMG
jgi:hypothetical protein